MSQKAKIVAGFPGVGKSYFTTGSSKPDSTSNYTFCDLDSTPFSHPDGKPSTDFPSNYITHIKSIIPTPNLILFIGVHDVVRDQLVANNLKFTLVYPERDLKPKYLQLYRDRGSPQGLVNKLDKEWDNFISSVQGQEGCKHVELKDGVYLSDVISDIITDDA